MQKMTFKVGQVVSIHPSSPFATELDKNNPTNPMYTRGKVVHIDSDQWIDVRWDNYVNSYRISDLMLNPHGPLFSKPKGMGKGTSVLHIEGVHIDQKYFNRKHRGGPQQQAISNAADGLTPSGSRSIMYPIVRRFR